MTTDPGKNTTQCKNERWPLLIVGVLIGLYSAYLGWYVLTATDRGLFGGFDLAIYDQALWNTAHGRWFGSTLEPGWSILLADHVEPILLPISLLYLLWDSPKALLLFQTVALALGALPVYWLARDALRAAAGDRRGGDDRPAAPLSQVPALAFVVAYLLYPPLHAANLFEFHPSALAAPLLLYALYFLRRKRAVAYFVFVLLAMSTKEVLPLTTAALGLYILLVRREWRLGLATIAVSAAWFVVAVYVIIPQFNPGGASQYFSFSYYSWLGGSDNLLLRLLHLPGPIVQRLASRAGPTYLAGLLAPLAGLPLLGLPLLLPALPTLILNALSDNMWQHSPGSYFHYAAPLVPFFIVAAIDGAAWLIYHLGRLAGQAASSGRRLVAPVAGLVLITSLLAQIRHGYLPFSRDFCLAAEPPETAVIKEFVRQIPAQSSVATVWYAAPFLSHRQGLYLYPQRSDADYMVVDAGYRDWPFPPRDRYDAVQDLLQSGRYGVRAGGDGYLLLERGLDQPIVPDRFYGFGRAGQPAPQFKTAVDFGDDVRLLGFDLVQARPFLARAHLVLYWQALRPIERDLRLFFIQTDPAGEPLPGTELEFTAPVWYPPARWSASEVIRTETFHWYLAEPDHFGLAIGVVDGPGLWDLDKRLRPTVHSAPWDMPAIHGGTLLWLATLRVADQAVSLEGPAGPVVR